MRFWIVLMLFLTAAPLTAQAKDLFVRQPTGEEQPAPAPAPMPETAPPDTSVAPFSLDTPEETVSDLAGRYYKNCLSKQDSELAGKRQEMLCGCSAQKVMELMTVADIHALSADTPEGQFQRNRMLIQVHAPCMEYPVRDILMEDCMQQAITQGKTPEESDPVCGCMAGKMAKYIAESGPAIVAKNVSAPPGGKDPFLELMNSEEFKLQAQTEHKACLASAGQEIPPTAPETVPPQPAQPGAGQ